MYWFENIIYSSISFDISTLYTSIPHEKLKLVLKEIIQNAFYFIVLGHELTYFVKHETKSKKCYTESEVITMLEFLIDNIFVEFWGHIFQQNSRHSYGIKLCHSLCRSFLILFIISVFDWLYVNARILVTCGKYLHDHAISIRGDVLGL